MGQLRGSRLEIHGTANARRVDQATLQALGRSGSGVMAVDRSRREDRHASRCTSDPALNHAIVYSTGTPGLIASRVKSAAARMLRLVVWGCDIEKIAEGASVTASTGPVGGCNLTRRWA